jgi:glycosyltransferase involved in cell wall biosynthesis
MTDIAVISASDLPGGAEAHTVALARGLAGRGHSPHLYGRCPGWSEAGLPVSALPLGPKWSGHHLTRNLRHLPTDHRQLRRIPPAPVYYLQFKREQIVYTRSLARRGRVIWTEHGRWLGGATGRALQPAYARAARSVSAIVCVSAAVADDLAPIVGRDKLVVIPNAIDTSRFSIPSAQRRAALRESLLPFPPGDGPVGLLASRLHSSKGHDRAISAALGAGLSLLVVGDGPDRERLQQMCAGSGQVAFLGWREDIADLMAAADVYLYSGGPTDGMPMAVLEALAAGLAVVGFAGDPGVELIERCGGIVLRSSAELSPQRLRKLLAEWSGAGRRHIVSEHGLDLWLDRFEEVLTSARP